MAMISLRVTVGLVRTSLPEVRRQFAGCHIILESSISQVLSLQHVVVSPNPADGRTRRG